MPFSDLVAHGRVHRRPARAYLLFVEYRRGETRWFSGRSTWRLRENNAGFAIPFQR